MGRRRLVARQLQGKRRELHLDAGAVFVDPEETTVGDGILPGDVVTIVGKALAGGQPGRLTDDALAFDDEVGAVGMHDHPFAAEQGDHAIGGVRNGDVINERVGFARRKVGAAKMMAKLIEVGREALDFLRRARHGTNRPLIVSGASARCTRWPRGRNGWQGFGLAAGSGPAQNPTFLWKNWPFFR